MPLAQVDQLAVFARTVFLPTHIHLLPVPDCHDLIPHKIAYQYLNAAEYVAEQRILIEQILGGQQ